MSIFRHPPGPEVLQYSRPRMAAHVLMPSRTPMSKVSPSELDLKIQLSLVAKIRQAAHLYKSAPEEPESPALLSYVAALECLAEYVAARCRESRPSLETAAPTYPLPVKRHLYAAARLASARLRTECRVIPFPAPNGGPSPLNVA